MINVSSHTAIKVQKTWSLPEIETWFAKHGDTDTEYLQAHFPRFERTFGFSGPALSDRSRVLDIGCHWLHQAYFFAQSGHLVTGADAPNTLKLPSVQAAAKAMNIELISYTRLDLGQGLKELPANFFDLVIFAEIIEHLAFNPLVLWKQIYRIMRPGSSIVVTTPNGLYYRYVIQRLNSLIDRGEFGIPVDDIFYIGTYGHHWKEFSVPELKRYFSFVSTDFEVERLAVETFGARRQDEEAAAHRLTSEMQKKNGAFDFKSILSKLQEVGGQPFGSQILIQLVLKQKSAGVGLSPPWLVE